MITHEEIESMREFLYRHGMALSEKIQKMFEAGELTQAQMNFAADVMKDLASVDKNLAKAYYYDSIRGVSSEKKY